MLLLYFLRVEIRRFCGGGGAFANFSDGIFWTLLPLNGATFLMVLTSGLPRIEAEVLLVNFASGVAWAVERLAELEVLSIGEIMFCPELTH